MRKFTEVLSLAFILTVLMIPMEIVRQANAGFTAFSTAWNAAHEGDPGATDAVGLGDDHMRAMKQEIRARLETTLDFGTGIGAGNPTDSDDGRPHQGTARIFKAADCSSATVPPMPVGAWVSGSNAHIAAPAPHLAIDEGALCLDDAAANIGMLKIWDGTTLAWIQAITRFEDNFTMDTLVVDVTGATTWLDDGSDSLILHDHGPRHNWTFTGGSWVASVDDAIIPAVPVPVAGAAIPLGIIPWVIHARGVATPAVGDIVTALSNILQIDSSDSTVCATINIDLTARDGTSELLFFINGMPDEDLAATGDNYWVGLFDGGADVVTRGTSQAIWGREPGASAAANVKERGGISAHWIESAGASDHTYTLRITDDNAAAAFDPFECEITVLDLGT